jgi:hypothetical protein
VARYTPRIFPKSALVDYHWIRIEWYSKTKRLEARTFKAETITSATIAVSATRWFVRVFPVAPQNESDKIETADYQSGLQIFGAGSKFPFDPKEPRECWAIFLALHMQIESKLGTANSLNLAAFNTPYVVPTSWIISCRRQVLYNKASYSPASNFAHAASV